MADLLSFVQKYKMAAATILNCYLVTLDHPRSLLHGWKSVHVNRFSTFGDMAIWKFCKFGLKCLFPPQKFSFWGFWPQTLFFVIETPQRHFLCRNRAFWATKRRDRSSGVTGTECKEYKKDSPERSPEKRGIGPAHTLNPILTIFGMWGDPMDVFL